MRSGKAPAHIPLPPKPTVHDIFSSSALASDLTPSSGVDSAVASPVHKKSQDLSADDTDGPSKSRSHRQSIGTRGRNLSTSGARRMSRNSWVDSVGSRRALLSPSYGQERGEDEDAAKPAIPSLAVGIRPAYSTPLPLLPMIVLCIVSDEILIDGLTACKSC